MDEQQQLQKKPNRAFIPAIPSGNLGFCKLNHILLVFHSINNQASQEEEEEENKTPMNNIIFHFKVTLILSISFFLPLQNHRHFQAISRSTAIESWTFFLHLSIHPPLYSCLRLVIVVVVLVVVVIV